MKDEQADGETYGIDAQIDYLCKRPDMVMGYNTLDTVMAYLAGFFNALQWAKEAPEAAAETAAEWTRFSLWLREKFPEHYAPCQVFRADCPADSGALANLSKLWSEYRSKGES